jgi:hypothetical protein
MAQGAESQRSSMFRNSLIQVRQDIPLPEFIYKSVCEVEEKTRSIRTVRWTEHQSISMELNDLIKV